MTSSPIFTADDEHQFTAAYEQFAGLVGQLNDPSSQKLDHGAIEKIIHTEGMELLRRLIQGYN